MQAVEIPILIAAGVAGVDIARKILDRIAQRRHWRVGRWGRILCIWQRVGEGCLRCETDYRYVRAHPTPYTGTDRTDTRALVVLCNACWFDLEPDTRLPYYGRLLNLWRATGAIRDDEWDATRTSVYAAVKAGL